MYKIGDTITLPSPNGDRYPRYGTVTEIHPHFVVCRVNGRLGSYYECENVNAVSRPAFNDINEKEARIFIGRKVRRAGSAGWHKNSPHERN